MQIKLIEGADALVKFIDSLATRAKKLDAEFHVAALSAVSHFQQHGDVTYINRVYLALGKGARHVAMTAWLTAFGGVSANEEKGKKDKLPFIKDGSKKVDLEEGAKHPWFTMKPSKAPDDVVDVYKLVLGLLKKTEGEGKQVVHAEMLQELRALSEKYAPAEEVEAAGEGDPLAGIGDE